MFSFKKAITSTFLSFLLASSAFGATVAVIDSGTDTEHQDLSSQLWLNHVERVWMSVGGDEDKNGYIDDFHGWNFIDNNNVLIDRDGIEQYSEDVRKYFELQYLMYLYGKGENLFTKELVDWYNNTLYVDSKLNMEIAQAGDFFGSYAHGTHVAGIVAKDNPDVKIITAKLIGSKAKLKFKLKSETTEAKAGEEAKAVVPSEAEMLDLKSQLGQLAVSQAERMSNIAQYIDGHRARVANASFGTGIDMTIAWLSNALAGVAKESIEELALHFQNELVAANKVSLAKAPKTLFVVAAGNDAKNIDIYPDSPASIVSDNVLSVAATWGRKAIADFSCYGTKTVHVAAPGVGILSAAPGGNYVYMNGTSQATPYVSKVASLIVDANPKLTPREIKEIIIGTVDVKPWLADKVMSSGIVNLERAVSVATSMAQFGDSLEEAIEMANMMVEDQPEEVEAKSITDNPIVIDNVLKNLVSKRPSPIIFE